MTEKKLNEDRITRSPTQGHGGESLGGGSNTNAPEGDSLTDDDESNKTTIGTTTGHTESKGGIGNTQSR